MYREKCPSYFNRVLGALLAAGLLHACSCLNPAADGPGNGFTFSVIDVGQGLAQMAVRGDTAVLFDIGPAEAYEKWHADYAGSGEPFLRAIVVSHQHADHWGGLERLDSTVRWSGLCVVSPCQDTAFYRGVMAQYWKSRIFFRTISARDSLALAGTVAFRCLWPEAGQGDSVFTGDALQNRYSLVFIARHGETGVLVTSDIDTAAERALLLREKEELRASLFIVPHHGSGSALDAGFYGYVRPLAAVISCANPNPYGHPSAGVLLWLSQMGVTVEVTAASGTCVFESNGYYWLRRRR